MDADKYPNRNSMPAWPDDLVEACVKQTNHTGKLCIAVLNKAAELGYADPRGVNEAAAQVIQKDLDGHNWQAWKISAYCDATRLLRSQPTAAAASTVEPCEHAWRKEQADG